MMKYAGNGTALVYTDSKSDKKGLVPLFVLALEAGPEMLVGSGLRRKRP